MDEIIATSVSINISRSENTVGYERESCDNGMWCDVLPVFEDWNGEDFVSLGASRNSEDSHGEL